MKALAIDLIRTDGGTQFRASSNDAKVQEYAGMLTESKEWPFDSPCIVFHDGSEYFLVDGFHRFHGARLAKRASINCDVRAGSIREAIQFALSANARHGLHRSNEDKRKAVGYALADAEWNKLSSRAIADMCGVGRTFVESLRKEESTGHGGQSKPETRTSKDGRQRPASKPKPKAEVVETVYEDAEPPEPAPQATAATNSPQALVAPIQAVATRLDTLLKDLAKLSDDVGGEWLDMTTIETQAKALKHTIRGGVFWVDCPECKGKGCKSCKQHGWLSRDRKQFLTQHQKDLLGVA